MSYKNNYNENKNNIFLENNPCGYKLNVNNPKINELYRRYKEWKNFSPFLPLTDEQRFDFESYILKTKTFKKLLNETPH